MDFTERSIQAAQCAVELAGRFTAKVTLLHVVAPGRRRSGDSSSEVDPLTLSQSRVQRAVAEVLQSVPFRRLSLTGDPARRIVEQARQEDAGLILMPTRGRRRWISLFNDSITARVIRQAHCPVWTSIGDPREPLCIKRILCALALTPSSSKVLHWASRFADRFGASLTIVNSNTGFAAVPGSCYDSELHAARKAWAWQDIADLQRDAGTQAEVWLEAGQPDRTVAAVARLIRADLVVVGKSPTFWFLGKLWNNAYDIVCEAPCPVAVC